MRLYLVSYDLNAPGQDYPSLSKAIEDRFNCIKVLKSQYLIETSLDAEGVYNYLSPKIDRNDRLLVCHFDKDHQGWMSKAVWDWVNARTQSLVS